MAIGRSLAAGPPSTLSAAPVTDDGYGPMLITHEMPPFQLGDVIQVLRDLPSYVLPVARGSMVSGCWKQWRAGRIYQNKSKKVFELNEHDSAHFKEVRRGAARTHLLHGKRQV